MVWGLLAAAAAWRCSTCVKQEVSDTANLARDIDAVICPFCLLCLFACHGHADTENIYDTRWTNAAVEASYDCVQSLTL